MILAQIETAQGIVDMLRTGGPWGLLALTITALAWLARAYVKARDEKDATVSLLNEKLTDLLKDTVQAAEQMKASNEKIEDHLDRIDRQLEKQ